MKHFTRFTLALLVVGFTFTATSASAQLLNANTSIQVRSTSSDSSTSARVDARTNETEPETGRANTNMSESSDAEGMTGFSLTRSQMDDNAEYSVSNASRVRSIASLESYAASKILKDERLESVEMKGGSLNLSYRKDTRFLGFFPGSMRAYITIDASGDVSVQYPWYALLMRTSETSSDLESRLDAEVAQMNSTEISSEGGVSANDSMWRWAQLFERVYAAVSAEVAASA